MKKLAAAIGTLVMVGMIGCGKSSDSGPIKIGAEFDLTMGESALDLPAANGAKLAVNEINASGGILGRQLELVVRDTKYDQNLVKQYAKEYVQQDQVSMVIGFTDTDSVLSAGPIIQAAQIPFVTVGATSPEIPAQVGDMMFLACFGDNVQAAAGAEFGYKKLGTSAYVLWDKDVHYTQLLHQFFGDAFQHLGGTITGDDTFADQPGTNGEYDFSAQIAKIKALPQQPSFYYVPAMPYNIGPLVQQFRAAGLTAPIVGGDGYDDPTWVATIGSASENVYFSTHALMDASGSDSRIAKFMSAYTGAFGSNAAPTAFSALGYDTVYLLADALKRAGSTDPGALKKALESTNGFGGITGSITLTASSHVPAKGVWIIRLQGGKYTLADEFVPDYIPAPPR